MTPQERQLVDDLFDRLAKVETAPRDADAQAIIADGQRRAPNAVYALVQTVLLQDEALRLAHERITELESNGAPEQAAQGGFLDTMRDALFGQSNQGQNQPRGSVPSVRPGDTGRPAWNTGQVMGQPQQGGYGQGGFGQGAPQGGQFGRQPMDQQQAPQAGRGGSFLGTAAAAAAGMVGGSLLMNSLSGMMGGNRQGFGNSANASESKSPWSSDSSGNDLAKDAGVNDIGNSSGQRSGNYDQAQADIDQDQDQDQDDMDDGDDFAGDFGGDDNG